MPMMLARAALAIAAIVAVVWFAVLAHDAYELDQGRALPKGNIADLVISLRKPSQFAKRIDELRSARSLTPDSGPDITIAGDYQLRHGPGDLERALRIVQDVVRREPQNLGAWSLLLKIEQFRFDQAGQRFALAHMHVLDPLDVKGP